MRRINYALPAVLLTIPLLLLAGCDSNSEASELAVAMDRAQRLTSRALTRLRMPVLRDPETHEVVAPSAVEQWDPNLSEAGENIELAPSWALHPGALTDLRKARKLLRPRIQAYAQLEEPDKGRLGLARSLLARVEWAIGRYHAAEATNVHNQARYLVSRATGSAQVMNLLADRISYFQRMSDLGEAEIENRRDQLRRQRRPLQSQLEQLTGELEQLRQRQETLATRHSELVNEAEAIRLRSETGDERTMQLHREAMQVMQQANEVGSELAAVEQELESKTDRLEQLRLQERQITQRVEAAETLIQARGEGAEIARQKAESLQRDLRQSLQSAGDEQASDRESIARLLTEAAQAVGTARDTERESLEAYRDALRQFDQAIPLLGENDQREQEADLLARKASVWMAMGRLNAQRLHLAQEAAELVETARALYQSEQVQLDVPQALQMLTDYADNRDGIRQQAADWYAQAAGAYEDVASDVDRNQRWIYQGRRVQALIGQARMQQDREVLQEAEQLLRDALQERGHASLVAELVRYQEVIARVGQDLAASTQ
ncbi:MAG: hypothetical protein ACOC93_01425 [Planctomycetota bacterium]